MDVVRLRLFGLGPVPTEEERQAFEAITKGKRRLAVVEVEEIVQEVEKFDVLFPVCDFTWEGSHLESRPARGPILAKELANALELVGIPQSLEMATRRGERATCGVVYRQQSYNNSQDFFYLREDLLRAYLKKQKLALIFFIWGQRERGGKSIDGTIRKHDKASPVYKGYHTAEIFK